MDIFEIEASLPNGFQDALVSRLEIDYLVGTLEFRLRAWIGDPYSGLPEDREKRRPALLRLEGLSYCAIESPHPHYPFSERRELMMDLVRPSPETAGPLLDSLPPGTFAFRIWVGTWNCFMHMAARSARLDWLGGDA